jgi:hypothetical protein
MEYLSDGQDNRKPIGQITYEILVSCVLVSFS